MQARIINAPQVFYTGFACISLLCIFSAILTETYILAAVPFVLLVIFQAIHDFSKLYYLLLACIPISMEFFFGNFGTDLPCEPLIIGLMLIYAIWLCGNWRSVRKQFLAHPLTILLFMHWLWILFTALNSKLLYVSIKFWLAKTWYIAVFYFLTAHFIRKAEDLRKLFWLVFIPLLLATLFVLVKHSSSGFSFHTIHEATRPFFRNHVNYAALLTLFFPFLLLARSWYPKYSAKKRLIGLSLFIFLIAIQFSYTRAAYLSLFLALGAAVVIHLRLIKYVLGLSLVVALLGVNYMIQNNKYLDYAPDYYKTITHADFDDLINATYNLEDISTMERVYRWVAGVRMAKDELLTGHGPGNFYNFYRSYTVTKFQTYVSNNPEKSGVHSYYLMVLIDQGLPGLLIFLALTFAVLIKGEQTYHEALSSDNKRVIMTLLLSTIIIDAFLLINDMVETAKVGSFFFMNIAILVNLDLHRPETELKNG